MDIIRISDLEVNYYVGVPDYERRNKQRLLVSVEIGSDFNEAARTDNLETTIDYSAVCLQIRKYGDGRSWRLIEKLAVDLAGFVLAEFKAATVRVEVKKFIIPETKFVAVEAFRSRAELASPPLAG
jgi:7,8-dihydroneopterin aldolase/epimerase/oxygenase